MSPEAPAAWVATAESFGGICLLLTVRYDRSPPATVFTQSVYFPRLVAKPYLLFISFFNDRDFYCYTYSLCFFFGCHIFYLRPELPHLRDLYLCYYYYYYKWCQYRIQLVLLFLLFLSYCLLSFVCFSYHYSYCIVHRDTICSNFEFVTTKFKITITTK
ncbi:unnamed protein product [Aphis gossypii]|uniref:Uncharacterized protein n=1 Tax=Aphis gossypii TaxID=80765 RepID=A0A9P0JC43_APHGO|nr:unnamed protein product [Aphis gossypii]